MVSKKVFFKISIILIICFSTIVFISKTQQEISVKTSILPNKFVKENKIFDDRSLDFSYTLKYKLVRRTLKFLFRINAFSIDIDFLKELKDTNYLSNKLTNLEYFKKFYYHPNGLPLSFGILSHQITNFTQEDINRVYNLSCVITYGYGNLQESRVLTNIYLKCKHGYIHLAVFYNRSKFYWIGNDLNRTFNYYFGDKPRAMHKFDLFVLSDSRINLMRIPLNIQKFLYDYKHSQFVECNRTSAQQTRKKFKQNFDLNTNLLETMLYVADVFENSYKTYWLMSGTALGWYRDCGIISYTTDVDFAMWSHDYEPKLKNIFWGNSYVSLLKTAGFANDSLFFRLNNHQYYFDVFFIYNVNETHLRSSYHKATETYSVWFRRFSQVCSGELLGHKFLVPCDPVKFLEDNYGDQWSNPDENGYRAIDWRHSKTWPDSLWPHWLKYYNYDGSLKFKKILKDLNEHIELGKPNVASIEPDNELILD